MVLQELCLEDNSIVDEMFDFPKEECNIDLKRKKRSAYFAEATRKSRKKKKELEEFLELRNCMLESDISRLKEHATWLKGEIDVSPGIIAHYKNHLKRQNILLKEEVRKLRLISENVKNQIFAINRITYIQQCQDLMNRNLMFMYDRMEAVQKSSNNQKSFSLSYTPIQVPEMLAKLLADALYNQGFAAKTPVYSDFHLFKGRNEFRSYSIGSHERVVRMDVFDVPIEHPKLFKVWGSIATLAQIASIVKEVDGNKDLIKTIFKEKDQATDIFSYDENDLVHKKYKPIVSRVDLGEERDTCLFSIAATELNEGDGRIIQAVTPNLSQDLSTARAVVYKSIFITRGTTEHTSHVTFLVDAIGDKECGEEAAEIFAKIAFENVIDGYLNYGLILQKLNILLQVCAGYV